MDIKLHPFSSRTSFQDVYVCLLYMSSFYLWDHSHQHTCICSFPYLKKDKIKLPLIPLSPASYYPTSYTFVAKFTKVFSSLCFPILKSIPVRFLPPIPPKLCMSKTSVMTILLISVICSQSTCYLACQQYLL